MGMYKVGIASRLYLSDGAVMCQPRPEDTRLRENSRRTTRTKTLDGGVVVTDGGTSHGDRTFEIAVDSDATLWAALWAMFNIVSWVTVTTDEGCFLGVMDSLRDSDGKIIIKVLVSESLSEE